MRRPRCAEVGAGGWPAGWQRVQGTRGIPRNAHAYLPAPYTCGHILANTSPTCSCSPSPPPLPLSSTVMEKYTRNARFCLICNYVSKIIPALQSRCTRFRFQPLPERFVQGRLEHICGQERCGRGGWGRAGRGGAAESCKCAACSHGDLCRPPDRNCGLESSQLCAPPAA